MKSVKTFILAGVLTVAAGVVSAATTNYYTAGTCAVTDVVSSSLVASDDCYGLIEKLNKNGDGVSPAGINDSEDLLNDSMFGDISVGAWLAGGTVNFTDGLFGHKDWDFLAKASSNGETEGSGLVAGLGGAPAPYNGTFSWTGGMYSQMVVILKQANSFNAYLFNGGLPSSGFWTTTALAFGNNAGGFSHISIYGRDPINEVPLPAAGFLLIGGLAGFAGLRRRKA